MTDLVPVDEQTIVLAIPPSVEMTDKGLVFHGRLTLREYLGLGELLFMAEDELKLAIGDLIVYGQDFLGEEWTQILKEHYAEQTIANLASICRRVGHDVRRPHETRISMYEVIAPFHEHPELQKTLLDMAIKNGWRRDEFRRFVKPYKEDMRQVGAVPDAEQIAPAVAEFNASLSTVEMPPFAPAALPPRGNDRDLEAILLDAFEANSRGDTILVAELLDKAIQRVRSA